MASKLKDKARGLDLSGVDDDQVPPDSTASNSGPPRTGPGLLTESIAHGRHMAQEVEQLRDKVAVFESKTLLEQIDPALIRASQWANRHVAAFSNKAFQALKEEIESAGGNVVPIKVRPIRDKQFRYEIVYGHRRHAACLELGLPVSCSVVTLTDAQLFEEMDRENRTRSDLSPFEQGGMYKMAIAKGLYSSQRALAISCGVSHAYVGLTMRMASLPDFVVKAFSSPMALQFRWLAPIEERLRSDPEGAKRDVKNVAGLSDQEVYERILGKRTPVKTSQTQDLIRDGKVIGAIKRGGRNAITISFKSDALSGEQLEAFISAANQLASA
jgi:ParB family chromosome partitioning protein